MVSPRLEKKGWLLNNENYSKNKFTDILLSASLSFKLPTEADTAIQLVTFLIWDQANEILPLLFQIIDKLIDKFKTPIENINESISSTKNFLNTTMQQQASELVSLQELIKQHADLAKFMANSSEGLNQSANPRGLTNAAWPPLAALTHSGIHQVHLASLLNWGAPTLIQKFYNVLH